MVSVIIPNYCHAPYLRQRIDSVLAQSYPDFEVVLLDDCSTDGSREVIERYRNHPRIKQIVYNDRNGGSAFAQWRKGFALTQGEYIWIAESDDYADPAFLERCVAELDADPACVLAHTLSRTVDSEGRPFGKVRHAGRPVRRMDGRRFVLRHLLRRNELYNASMAVFRRSALPAAGEYEGFRYAGDWYFWMLVALQGRVSTVFEPLSAFFSMAMPSISSELSTPMQSYPFWYNSSVKVPVPQPRSTTRFRSESRIPSASRVGLDTP